MAFQFDLSPATGSLLRHNTVQKHSVQWVGRSVFVYLVSKSVSGQLSCNRQFVQNLVFLSVQSRPGTNG
jgi:hypothetical protein